MRILFWTNEFWPQIGGVQIFAARLLTALKKRGYEFLVATSEIGFEKYTISHYHGIPIYRFPFRNPKSYTDINRLINVKRQVAKLKRIFAPEIIHMNVTDFSTFFHLTTVHAYPAPVLLTLHASWLSQNSSQNSLIENTMRSSDWIVGCSEAILEKARQLVPEILSRSSVIYNSLETPFSASVAGSPAPPRLLCIGRLTPEKGFDIAITAFASLVKRYPHVRLVIAGDGPSRKDLERQAAKLNIGDVLEFVGWIAPDDVASLIRSSTLVLIPSRLESFGLVALETALMARPVVATRVGGLPEVVAHEETGLLVEQEDPNALAKAAEYLLRHPKTALKMGWEARKRAQKLFGWEQHVDAYDALYQRLVSISSDQRRP